MGTGEMASQGVGKGLSAYRLARPAAAALSRRLRSVVGLNQLTVLHIYCGIGHCSVISC